MFKHKQNMNWTHSHIEYKNQIKQTVVCTYIHSHARAKEFIGVIVLLNTKMDCSRDKYILNVKKEKEKRNNIHLIEKTP